MEPEEEREQEAQLEKNLEAAVVKVILAARAIYLANGANALKHWEQLGTRLKRAALTTAEPADFVSKFCAGLGIDTSGSPRLGAAVVNFTNRAAEFVRWRQIVEQRIPFLIASAQVAIAEAKAAKEAAERIVRV